MQQSIVREDPVFEYAVAPVSSHLMRFFSMIFPDAPVKQRNSKTAEGTQTSDAIFTVMTFQKTRNDMVSIGRDIEIEKGQMLERVCDGG